jgi:hypothetical protein
MIITRNSLNGIVIFIGVFFFSLCYGVNRGLSPIIDHVFIGLTIKLKGAAIFAASIFERIVSAFLYHT